jgi:hypothetical protein
VTGPVGATAGRIAVGVESTPKRVFASALEWPGWTRAGRDEAAALAALAASGERYAAAAREAGIPFGPITPGRLEVVEHLPGTPTTVFGAPDVVFALDGRPTDAADGGRLAALVRAAWTILERVVASAPADLRKGPRGGGRDRDAIAAHVVAAENAYARGGPGTPHRRRPDRRRPLARPVRGPAHRMARPGPRVGDRGPRRSGLNRPANTRQTAGG